MHERGQRTKGEEWKADKKRKRKEGNLQKGREVEEKADEREQKTKKAKEERKQIRSLSNS